MTTLPKLPLLANKTNQDGDVLGGRNLADAAIGGSTDNGPRLAHFHQLSCHYNSVGCEFVASTESELTSHYANNHCITNHLKYTVVELENLKQQMALQNQSIKKYQQNVEKIQLGHKIALAKANNSIQPEKNISSVAETDSRKVLEEINMNKENTTMAIPPQIEKFIEKAPLWSFKNLYFVYQMQSSLAEIKDELSVEKKLSEDLSKQMKILQEQMRKIQGQVPGKEATQLWLNRNANSTSSPNSTMMIPDSGYQTAEEKMKTDSNSLGSTISEVPNEKITELINRVESLEKTCEELKNDRERCKQLERFVMHLHERIKSLDCGRTGVFIWKITGFEAIFDNAKKQHELKLKGLPSTDAANSACDFCSPLFYTAPNGYLMYMRLYPFGCDSAAGNFVSLFVALSPGEYDGVLKWPFLNSIEISLLSQEDPADKWTQVITPGGNNMTCFQRPSSKSGNMSVGILHFIVHNKIYKESPYKKNDTIYVEVRIRENENAYTGPTKAKVPRSSHGSSH